jgi:hypothetical protein
VTTLTRRDVLRYLLMTPMALTLDVEQLLWVPKPIIVVPSMPVALTGRPSSLADLMDAMYWKVREDAYGEDNGLVMRW